MTLALISVAMVIAVLDWVAVASQSKTLEYLGKPGVMVALIALAVFWSLISQQLLWFAFGLVCCMVGDILLILPKEKFIAGLVAFLLGQIFYLVGLNTSLPPENVATLVLAIMVLLVAARLYRAIALGLETSGEAKLKMPVLAYSSVISLMLLSALITLVRPEWTSLSAFLVSGGALLFFISDSLLAWNKFVRPLPNGRLLSIVPYHLGQVMITLGAVAQFAK